MKKYMVVMMVVFVLAGFIRGESDQEIIQAIESILDIQEGAWNRGDLNGFMAHYWKSDQLIFQSGSERVFGWRTMINRYREKYLPDKMGKIDFFDIIIRVLGSDTAVVAGKVKDPSSDQSHDALFTLVFKKIDGQWLIILDHTS